MNERVLPRESTPTDSHTTSFEGQTVDVYRLIDLSEDLPVKRFPLTKFTDCRENNYWHDSKGGWLGPHSVIEALDSCADGESLVNDESVDVELRKHVERVLDADYESYPVLMVGDTLVDGLHRLTKAMVDRVESIPVVQFTDLPSETVV